jgi:predicted AAA+ superfamily ATPase
MKSIVASQKIERDELLAEAFIPRHALKQAAPFMDSKRIKVVIGPRRAGKSVFALQMLKTTGRTDFAYVNFDDERLRPPLDLDNLLAAMIQVYGDTKTLFFDEIQNAEGWELFVNRLQRRGYNLVLTGSNAHLLSNELSTHLTGRYHEVRMLPFSFPEYLDVRAFEVDERLVAKERQGQLLRLLDDYLLCGGYPDIVVSGDPPDDYLKTLFESILFKDVVKRHNVRDATKLYDVAQWLIGNVAREYTCTSLNNALGCRSVHTVDQYVTYLIDAFLFMSVSRYSPKAKLRMTAPRKIYGYDPGMINAVRFRAGRDTGRLLENLVAVELYLRGVEFYTYKTSNGKEVDFLLRATGEADKLLQVCYDLSELKTRQREIQSLRTAGIELNHSHGTILTWDEEGQENIDDFTISLLPAWKWLLNVETA